MLENAWLCFDSLTLLASCLFLLLLLVHGVEVFDKRSKEKMGFLLKEALKSLCDRNQWSYAVFWKIGCQNSKLLIWEDCYYEPLPCPFPPRNFGTSSQLGIQEEDRVGSLINKMAVNNSVVVAV